jgi:hypothetical protein
MAILLLNIILGGIMVWMWPIILELLFTVPRPASWSWPVGAGDMEIILLSITEEGKRPDMLIFPLSVAKSGTESVKEK